MRAHRPFGTIWSLRLGLLGRSEGRLNCALC